MSGKRGFHAKTLGYPESNWVMGQRLREEIRLRERAEEALAAQIKAAEDDCHRWDEMERKLAAEKWRADRYLAAIVEYVEATAAEEKAEEVYTSFGSRMMDRSLPPVTEAEVDAAFVAVANARNRAYAATGAIRAIVEEGKL